MPDTAVIQVRRALLSVSDKTGLIDFARGLHDLGVELVSTGGTFRALKDADLPAIEVSSVTEFPEMMDGRVKTLHPKIHGGILGRRDVDQQVMEAQDIEAIDLVCVNLYPFEETIANLEKTHDDAIENIDIGGPAMVRSAAKNHQFVITFHRQKAGNLAIIQEDILTSKLANRVVRKSYHIGDCFLKITNLSQ